jgi:multiple sugar transport system permease protein
VASPLQAAPPARPRRALTDRGTANLFLLPTVLLLVAMNVFPLFWSLYHSFTRYVATANKGPQWIGGENYSRLLVDKSIWNNFTVTAEFTLLSVLAQLIVGFGMAMLLNRQFRAKGIITTLILLPMMLSPVVVGLFWKFMLDSNWGLVNWILQALHLQHADNPFDWINNPTNAMWSLVLVDTWMWSPFVMLISLAGLNAVPPHLYEAAEVDRASAWFKFRYITVPMVAPLVMIALLFRCIDCFKIFDMVYVLTGGGPGEATKTASYSLYKQAFDTFNTGYACALGYIILLVIIGLANLYIQYLSRIRGESLPDSTTVWSALAEKFNGVPPLARLFESPMRLLGLLFVITLIVHWQSVLAAVITTRGILLALAAVGVVVAITMRLPKLVRDLLAYGAIAVAVVFYLLPIYWIVATSFKPVSQVFVMPPKFVPTHMAKADEPPSPGYAFGLTTTNYDSLIYQREDNKPTGKITGYTDFPGQLWNSLYIGAVSTFLAVALGTMAAYAFSRFNVKGKGDLLFFVLSTRMMPAIVAVIPIFVMYQHLNLLNKPIGLIILYTVFNLSFSTYLLKGFFDDIPHEYDDAALLDGYSRLQAFRKISLPQALTGIAATAVFCFITAWNEFAFAQILSTEQPLTAPPSIVARTGAAGTDWGQIAAGAVVFLIPAAVFTFIMRKHLLRGVTFGAIKR